MLKRVYSIDEAVMLVQGRLAAADNKTVADYAWMQTPVSSTRVQLYTPTPYVKNQEQLDDVCDNTNVKASMTSKHNVMLSFDPNFREPEEQSTTVQLVNWYQVMQEENKTLKADNERLKAEIERLKAKNERLKAEKDEAEAEEEKLYWIDQNSILERKCTNELEGLRELLHDCQQELIREQALVKELQQSTVSVGVTTTESRNIVNTQAFRDVYEQMFAFLKQGYDRSVERSANLLLGMAGEPFDSNMSVNQLLHKVGDVMASKSGEFESTRSKHLYRAIRLALKSLNKKMDPEVLAQYREMVNELSD